MNKILLILVLLAVLSGLAYYVIERGTPAADRTVTSFEECVAEGNPVMESYPRQCRSQNGELFVEQIEMDTEEPVSDGARIDPGEVATDDEGPAVEQSGTIRSIDLEQMMVDGPARIVLETTTGETVTITVPSMGLPLCAARATIADVALLEVGNTVAVRGSINAEGEITPCTAADHYLRVTD